MDILKFCQYVKPSTIIATLVKVLIASQRRAISKNEP